MSSTKTSIQQYIERQPRLAWRRSALNNLIRAAMRVATHTEVTGMDNIPDTGPTILMMNHISALDPGLVMGTVRKRYVIPMTKAEAGHSMLGFLVWWYGAFTVNRGEVDRRALTNSIELLHSGQLVLIAPEGTRNQSGLIEPRPGLSYIASKTGAAIVPATISGAVGWKEKLTRLQRPHIRLNFGPPFRFKTNGHMRVPREDLNQMMHEAMYQLALAIPDPSIRGVYSDVANATTRTLEFLKSG